MNQYFVKISQNKTVYISVKNVRWRLYAWKMYICQLKMWISIENVYIRGKSCISRKRVYQWKTCISAQNMYITRMRIHKWKTYIPIGDEYQSEPCISVGKVYYSPERMFQWETCISVENVKINVITKFCNKNKKLFTRILINP